MNIKVSLSKNLWRTSAQAHELEIKSVCSNFIPHGMSTVIFQFPHRSMIFYPIMKEKSVANIQLQKNLRTFFVLHLTHQHQRSNSQIRRNGFRQEPHGINPIQLVIKREKKVQLFISHGVNVRSPHCLRYLVYNWHQFLEFGVKSKDIS